MKSFNLSLIKVTKDVISQLISLENKEKNSAIYTAEILGQ